VKLRRRHAAAPRNPPEHPGRGDDEDVGEIEGGRAEKVRRQRLPEQSPHERPAEEKDRVEGEGAHHQQRHGRNPASDLLEQIVRQRER
jgi:hypothetical protein